MKPSETKNWQDTLREISEGLFAIENTTQTEDPQNQPPQQSIQPESSDEEILFAPV